MMGRFFWSHSGGVSLSLLTIVGILVGCGPERPALESTGDTPLNRLPETVRVRTRIEKMATHFSSPPVDAFRVPEFVEISLPDFRGSNAIWGATGRDDRGHIWLGVSAKGIPQPSAHLLEYIPQADGVFDRGSVLEALQKVRPLSDDESQMKIHSKICPADDGYLYFASMDEEGEESDGSAYPVWGGHLWRLKPWSSEWEHLLSTKEALIAVGCSGRWIYALGYFQHVLYQFDTQMESIRKVQVGSVGGHVSRNFLVDLNGHVFVPRVRRHPDNGDELVAELVEWDEELQEIQAVPLPDYEPSPDFESHGIVGWTYLANGDVVFTTSSGGLWRIQPANPKAIITRLGPFHPEGRCYYQWVVYDLEKKTARALELNQEPFLSKRQLLLYGSNTRDNDGNGYIAGRTSSGPILLKVMLAKARS